MKAKLFYSVGITLLSLLIFSSFKTINSKRVIMENNSDKKFLITALHCGADPNNINGCNPDFTSSFYSNIKDTLRFNSWHRYNRWFCGDIPFGDSAFIAQGISNTLAQNNQRDLATVFDRPITRYLAYGQRSDYQCEKVPTGNDYYFHSYENSIENTYVSDITDNSSFGNGVKVKYCGLNAGSPGVWEGYVVKDLRANREQCNRIIDHTRDDTYNWYVKPRIRIDTAFANNPINQDVKVCRIEIVDWNGDVTRNVDIKVRNFKANDITRYEGNYLEEYYFTNNQSAIILFPTELCPTTVPMKDFTSWNNSEIKTDFRVYWYGECAMYLDYVRVENEPANELFNSNNVRHNYLMNRMVSEINLAANNSNPSNPNNFYNEEFEFNMTPSTQALSKIIETVSQGRISFMVNLNMEMYNVHIPRYWVTHLFKASEFKKYLLDSSKIKTVLVNAYNLEGWNINDSTKRESYNPNTLPVYSKYPDRNKYDTLHGLLTYPTTPTLYDNWLQYNFDDNPTFYYKFTNINKIIDSMSKLPNANFDIMFLHQSHMWHQINHKLKEPTNEELEMTANLHLTYGAKGLMYFAYNGVCVGNGYNTTYAPSGNPPAFSAGFVDQYKNKRDTNAYGQNKWNFYKSYNRKLEKWDPYIMSFNNNRKSYIVRSEISNLTNETYFNDILSYQSDPFDYSSPVSLAEPIGQRYLQAAVFENPNEEDSKYFMVVNRRGSPVIASNPGGTNGRRSVTVKLDSGSATFPKFNNWGVYDLEKDSLIKSFDKRLISTINLGWFLPGEGKLYKLAPVMQEGGTLVANEQIEGITFICNGPVYNNGKDISILEGTKINFKTGAGITINGGKLTCSNYSTNTSENVLLKGYNGYPWKGIVMNNCMRSVIQRTRFEDAMNCIVISNDDGGSRNIAKVIRRNYFKVTTDSGKALSINNQMEMAIDSYTFEVTSLKSN